ncbi:MAG TPA: glutathione S-transferase family protein [Caulobacteraceae bacterium]
MARPIVYGAAYSVYVQAVRLTLWAKAIAYDLVDIDVFAPGGPGPEYLVRHPFGRIPAFQHDGVQLYETAPICRYVDEAFPGPVLQPAHPLPRAVMGQAISIMDNYAYRYLVWGVYFERIEAPRQGRSPDPDKIEVARRQTSVCLGALERLAPSSDWLAGDTVCLADLHAAPMFRLFMQTPDADDLMQPNPRLQAWWSRVEQRVAPAQVL